MSKLKVAIIGCGGAGKNHAVGYSRLEHVEIVAAADIYEEKAAALTEQFGGTAYSSYETMIECEKPDIVSICTREYSHDQPALYALSHGCQVFCEKIMAHELQLGEEMVKTAEKHNQLLGVNYNYRFIDSVNTLKEIIASGELGELRSAVFHTHVFCHHHTLDMLRYLFGEPEAVTATFTEDLVVRNPNLWNNPETMLYVPDLNACTILRFGRLLVTIMASHRPLEEFPLIDIQLYGSKGSAIVSNMMINQINGTMKIQADGNSREIIGVPLSLNDIFYRSVEAFVDAVRGNREISSTGQDGLKMMQLEHAISRSHYEKKSISLD